ncbi:MAG: hypothetical protein JWO96_164 [Candidatus Saccharibacteria bacterium]|nr:hypothetical protein [Candidatus Saccharibacteria bacterium]
MRTISESVHYVSESEAILAAVDNDAASSLVGVEGFKLREVMKSRHGKDLIIVGHCTSDSSEAEFPVQALVVFPNFIERSIARVRGREPRAHVNLEVIDPSNER